MGKEIHTGGMRNACGIEAGKTEATRHRLIGEDNIKTDLNVAVGL
jgi:hypothetical protein